MAWLTDLLSSKFFFSLCSTISDGFTVYACVGVMTENESMARLPSSQTISRTHGVRPPTDNWEVFYWTFNLIINIHFFVSCPRSLRSGLERERERDWWNGWLCACSAIHWSVFNFYLFARTQYCVCLFSDNFFLHFCSSNLFRHVRACQTRRMQSRVRSWGDCEQASNVSKCIGWQQ